jgi:zinc protease
MIAYWMVLIWATQSIAADAPVSPLGAPELALLSKGGRVAFFADPQVPVVDFQWIFPIGEKRDPRSREGLQDLLSRLAEKAPALRRLEAQGVSVEVASGLDHFSVSAHGLSADRDLILREIGSFFAEPAFRQEDLNFERLRTQEQWTRVLERPDGAATYLLQRILMNGSPYQTRARAPGPVLSKILLEDLRQWWATQLVRKNMTVLAIGDIGKKSNRERLIEQIDQVTATVKSDGEVREPTKESQPFWTLAPNEIGFLDRPGSSQVEVRVAWTTPDLSLKEMAPASIVDALFCGYFESRLNQRLRDALGITYGVSGQFWNYRGFHGYVVQTNTQSASVGVLLRELQYQLTGLKLGGVGEQEMEVARKYMTGSIPLSLASQVGFAYRWGSGQILGFPDDYMKQYLDRISGVSVADLSDTIKRFFSPRQPTIVLVGDKKSVLPVLKKFGFEKTRLFSAKELGMSAR